MALTEKKPIEYKTEEDPLMLNKDKLVKITGKRRKRKQKLAAADQEEQEREIQALLAQPADEENVKKAVMLAEKSRLKASDVTDKGTCRALSS